MALVRSCLKPSPTNNWGKQEGKTPEGGVGSPTRRWKSTRETFSSLSKLSASKPELEVEAPWKCPPGKRPLLCGRTVFWVGHREAGLTAPCTGHIDEILLGMVWSFILRVFQMCLHFWPTLTVQTSVLSPRPCLYDIHFLPFDNYNTSPPPQQSVHLFQAEWTCDRDLANQNPPTQPQWLVLGMSIWIEPGQWDSVLRLLLELLRTLFRGCCEATRRWAYWQPSCPSTRGWDGVHPSSLWGMLCEVGAEVLLPLNHGIWNSTMIVPLAHVGLPDSTWQCPLGWIVWVNG